MHLSIIGKGNGSLKVSCPIWPSLAGENWVCDEVRVLCASRRVCSTVGRSSMGIWISEFQPRMWHRIALWIWENRFPFQASIHLCIFTWRWLSCSSIWFLQSLVLSPQKHLSPKFPWSYLLLHNLFQIHHTIFRYWWTDKDTRIRNHTQIYCSIILWLQFIKEKALCKLYQSKWWLECIKKQQQQTFVIKNKTFKKCRILFRV